jgi:hypothetical protein
LDEKFSEKIGVFLSEQSSLWDLPQSNARPGLPTYQNGKKCYK